MSNVRLRRLAADFERMQSYVRRHPRVKLVQTEGSPPEKYQLQYVVRSLRQVGGELREHDSHMVEITLPRNYPRTPPQCRMLSPVFHPNIAPHAICVGDHWGAGEPLESIVIRIGEMLAFQSYNVKSPLNGDAARWVEQNLDRLPTDKASMLAEEGAAPAEVNGHANGHAAGAAQPSFAAFDEFRVAPPMPAAPQASPPFAVPPVAPPVIAPPPVRPVIDHIALQTANFDAAIDFYTRILGAELLERRQFKRRQMAWLRLGDVRLELFSAREGETLAEWSDLTCGPVHLAIRVGNLKGFLEGAFAAGAQFHPSHPGPFTPPVAGARPIAYLLGPDGEEVEIRDELP